MFNVSEVWKSAYPEGAIGLLTMQGVANPRRHPLLESRKRELEGDLRSRFAGYDRPGLRALPVLRSYGAYYKQFNKTYHVQLQLESVVLKGSSIPDVAALVEAMFMAELKNLLLTAGHDLDAIEPPVCIDVATGGERYLRMGGEDQAAKAGDMMITDAKGILSTILYGPDHRTRIMPDTRRVLFTVYAPPGVGEELVYQHLEDIREYVLVVAQEANVEVMQVLVGEGLAGRAPAETRGCFLP